MLYRLFTLLILLLSAPAWGASVYWRSNTTERDAITGMASGDWCWVIDSNGQNIGYTYSGSDWVLPTWPDGGSGFTIWEHSNTESATYGTWNFGGYTHADVDGSRDNHVLSLGYNIGNNGAPAVADQPAFRLIGGESHYDIDGNDVFEFHLAGFYPASSSTEQRTMTMFIRKATGYKEFSLHSDKHYFRSTDGTKWVVFEPTGTVTLHSIDSRNGELEWRVQNTDNTSGHSTASSILTLMTAGANGGDPFVRFVIDSATNWSVGTDNSDGDKFKISEDWNIGGSDRLTIPKGGGVQIGSGSRPTCDSGVRGMIFYVAGGAGVADTLEVCRKDASNNYAWASLF